jgi:hypothetical protein
MTLIEPKKKKGLKLRQIRVEGDIAYVPLTRGVEAIIDAEDAEKVGQWNWYCGTQYVQRTNHTRCSPSTVKLHRYLMGETDCLVDHKNGNKLDNRKFNLRLANKSQNGANSKMTTRNRSGFKGVYFHKSTSKWQAQIRHNCKFVYLGLFDAPEKAHAAYVAASQKYHGAFGRTQ